MLKKTFLSLAFVSCLTFSIFANEIESTSESTSIEAQKYYVAIVIDDFGNGGSENATLENAKIDKDISAMIALPIPITGAVIPGQPNAPIHAQLLKEANHGIIVHMPMEAKKQRSEWNTPYTISSSLGYEEIAERTKAAIEHVGFATGLNNHTGSAATESKEAMKAVIETVANQNLLMLDSVTSSKSKIQEVAEELDLNYLRRDVFLDDGKQSVDFVTKRMKETLKVAKKQGYAIAIGHVGPSGGMNTVNGIAGMIDYMQSEGVVFVTIDELHKILHDGHLHKSDMVNGDNNEIENDL